MASSAKLPKFNFGKYTGVTVDQIPGDYLSWIAGATKVDTVRDMATAELDRRREASIRKERAMREGATRLRAVMMDLPADAKVIRANLKYDSVDSGSRHISIHTVTGPMRDIAAYVRKATASRPEDMFYEHMTPSFSGAIIHGDGTVTATIRTNHYRGD